MKQTHTITPSGSTTAPTPHPAGVALLDPKAAAALLGLSYWTLAELRCNGDGPRYSKLLNRVRYRQADLDAWIDAHTARSTSEHDAKKAG
jgi:predicted DNA-binding transcriptional regulator AlpA